MVVEAEEEEDEEEDDVTGKCIDALGCQTACVFLKGSGNSWMQSWRERGILSRSKQKRLVGWPLS